MEASRGVNRRLARSWRSDRTRRARLTDRLVAVGLLAWAAPDVPWWWRPPGHSAATLAALGYLALMLAQSVPFLWWRRIPLLAAGLAATVLAIRPGSGTIPTRPRRRRRSARSASERGEIAGPGGRRGP